jgi:hypothetical protein
MARLADGNFGMWIYDSGYVECGVQIFFDDIGEYVELEYVKDNQIWQINCCNSPNNCRHTLILNKRYSSKEELVHSRCNFCNKYFLNIDFHAKQINEKNIESHHDKLMNEYIVEFVFLTSGHLCCKRCSKKLK